MTEKARGTLPQGQRRALLRCLRIDASGFRVELEVADVMDTLTIDPA